MELEDREVTLKVKFIITLIHWIFSSYVDPTAWQELDRRIYDGLIEVSESLRGIEAQ